MSGRTLSALYRDAMRCLADARDPTNTQTRCRLAELLAMERSLLSVLGFDVSAPTSLKFLGYYMHAVSEWSQQRLQPPSTARTTREPLADRPRPSASRTVAASSLMPPASPPVTTSA